MPDEKKKFITADEILVAEDLETRELFIPEWSAHVRIRAMDAFQWSEFWKHARDGGGFDQWGDVPLRVNLVAFSLVDENGERMFSVDHVRKLASKNWQAIKRISDVAMALNRGDIESEESNF